ncbi:hypothetical protein T4D_4749 [Trichinella pseudospiralis]|uniref:KRAB-A domain-containing protein 2 n=1 Tax=Trichinella pseudospiralis TaxID=6337 RepID=A0A0V1FT88_TRIPS|nr:hypothetical protein T4D_4749 [Trichinella pseudospiralis]
MNKLSWIIENLNWTGPWTKWRDLFKTGLFLSSNWTNKYVGEHDGEIAAGYRNFKHYVGEDFKRLLQKIIFLSVEEIFDVIRDVHLATSYGDPGRILHKVKKKYANVIRLAVKAFIELCESCQRKQKTTNRKRLVVKPIIYLTMLRCYLKDNPDVRWSDALKMPADIIPQAKKRMKTKVPMIQLLNCIAISRSECEAKYVAKLYLGNGDLPSKDSSDMTGVEYNDSAATRKQKENSGDKRCMADGTLKFAADLKNKRIKFLERRNVKNIACLTVVRSNPAPNGATNGEHGRTDGSEWVRPPESRRDVNPGTIPHRRGSSGCHEEKFFKWKQRKDEFVREYPDRQSWLFFKSLPVMEVLSGTTLLQQFKAGIRRAQLKMSRVMSRNRAYTRHAILGDIAHSRAIEILEIRNENQLAVTELG